MIYVCRFVHVQLTKECQCESKYNFGPNISYMRLIIELFFLHLKHRSAKIKVSIRSKDSDDLLWHVSVSIVT